MIERLLQIQALTSNNHPKLNQFNATLPILIQVLKKTKANHYLLLVGNKTLETKSLKELEVGGRYFALMKHSSMGNIMLSSLRSEPKVPQNLIELSLGEAEEILKRPSKMRELGEYALDKLAQSKTREEFLNWGFFLLGIQKNILSFWIGDAEKRTFLQIKAKKREIVFYAIFPHLGEMNGRIFSYKNSLNLCLKVAYENVASFLHSMQRELIGIDELHINVEENISALFMPKEQLLDLKI